MRYDKPGHTDPVSWGPTIKTSREYQEEKQHEQRLQRLTHINAIQLRNAIPKNDDIALEIASHIGRYISDITLVDLIRAAMKGDRHSVSEIIRRMMDESIELIAEEKAAQQIEKYA